MQFKIGDRVTYKAMEEFGVGVVRGFYGDTRCIVEFENEHDFLHDCLGELENKKGYYCSEHLLKREKDIKIKKNIRLKGFKVGDRVKHDRFGVGVVKNISTNVKCCFYAIEFDETNRDFHTCGGSCRDNHGYWCDADELVLEEKEVNIKENDDVEFKLEDKFQLGDRVICNSFGIGTIIGKEGSFYAVEFDEESPGLHNCKGLCKTGKGLWFKEEDMKSKREMDMKFKIGDRVAHYIYGEGIIRDIEDSLYVVEFDKGNRKLHTCHYKCKNYHGWWCNSDEIKKVTHKVPHEVIIKEKIILCELPPFADEDVYRIEINEPYVTVSLKSGCIGKAICCEGDTFDAVIGYRIAYKRAKIEELKEEIRIIGA